MISHAGNHGVIIAVVRPQALVALVVLLIPEGVVPEAVAKGDNPRPLLKVQLHIQVVVEVLFAVYVPIPAVRIAALIACGYRECLFQEGKAALRNPPRRGNALFNPFQVIVRIVHASLEIEASPLFVEVALIGGHELTPALSGRYTL